jgi:hypothetical protein
MSIQTTHNTALLLGHDPAAQSSIFPSVDHVYNAFASLARTDAALMGTLAVADEMARYELLQGEYQDLLNLHPQFADEVEFVDPYVCTMSQLAGLIAQAPTAVTRQTLREVAYCREQMALMLGLESADMDARSQVVLAGANAEWEIQLSLHPTFSAWLSTIDRFTCSRTMLADAMLHAPTSAIRHALRETFCFRKVASLITEHEFA